MVKMDISPTVMNTCIGNTVIIYKIAKLYYNYKIIWKKFNSSVNMNALYEHTIHSELSSKIVNK